MEAQNELIERVVRMQLTSPNFAEYCIEHVTDPKHRFLFSSNNNNNNNEEESNDRQLYTRLLTQQSRSNSTNNNNNNNNNNNKQIINSQNERNQTTLLWTSLLDYFSSIRNVHGPHMPHMFRAEKDLINFIEMLTLAQHDCNERQNIVRFMLWRLPMTETFLYTINYMCDVYVYEACKVSARPSQRCNNSINNNNNNEKNETTRSVSPLASTMYSALLINDNALQQAGTLLFIVNMLLLEHEALEHPLRYKAAFEIYLYKMVETLAKAAPKESQVLKYVQETVSVWAASHLFTEETIRSLKEISGCS